ncbi:MAG: betaine/proline/choline family ABC transporter ATP-binding protein [Dongiaceae bacterium]
MATVRCEKLWKVFGTLSASQLAQIRDQNLTKEAVATRFNAVLALRNVSFEVQKGRTFCIMGLSGCGKSTLLRHVNRLIEPSFGQVHLDEVLVSALDRRALGDLRSRKIGMVFQSYGLFPHLTIAENVAFGLEVRKVDRRKRREVAQEKLRLVGLADWADRLPGELSGGMKQRVGLARALANDPEILLMDEPFSALDPLIRRELQDEYVAIAQSLGKTTIFITHDFEEALRVGDELAIMRDGEFLQVGTPDEILRRPADAFVAKFVAMATDKLGRKEPPDSMRAGAMP